MVRVFITGALGEDRSWCAKLSTPVSHRHVTLCQHTIVAASTSMAWLCGFCKTFSMIIIESCMRFLSKL